MGLLNFRLSGELANDVGTSDPEVHFVHQIFSATDATASSTTGILAAVTDTGVEQTITENLSNPNIPRNITATAGGTAADIGAIQVIVVGTNILDEEITETLPVFTANTAGSVQGNKAFKTVTSVTIPAHDGTGATTSIGYSNKLQLDYYFSAIGISFAIAFFDGGEDVVEEGEDFYDTTYAYSLTNIENNTILCANSLAGKQVDVYCYVE